MLGIFCIDLIGRYQFTPKGLERKYQKTNKNVESVYLQAVTMIDPVTGWIEICTTLTAQADLLSNQVVSA